MALEDRTYIQAEQAATQDQIDQGLRAYMLSVYNYMASGVALTGIVSWLIANTSLNSLFFTVNARGMMEPNILTWGSMLVSIGMVFFLSMRLEKIQASTAQALFWAYAALNGVWLASIFSAYTGESIVRVFFISAASFAALSLYGYTTKRDLSAFGSFLMMGLFGIVIASVVNIFLGSSMLGFVISAVGVLVFAGLTAYDTQKIKDMYLEADCASTASKKAIMGALNLYLDFINLFLMLLRFFGDRR
jgi:FtsH-binding integral membrane protein